MWTSKQFSVAIFSGKSTCPIYRKMKKQLLLDHGHGAISLPRTSTKLHQWLFLFDLHSNHNPYPDPIVYETEDKIQVDSTLLLLTWACLVWVLYAIPLISPTPVMKHNSTQHQTG
jgi:hypothetical protein